MINIDKLQGNLSEAWERFQELLKSCPHHGFNQQRIMHIFYGGVPSHNRTSLDATCQGNMMMKPPIDAIKIIEDMRSNPYNNSKDKRIMKITVNQVEDETTTSRFGQQIQIETLMISARSVDSIHLPK